MRSQVGVRVTSFSAAVGRVPATECSVVAAMCCRVTIHQECNDGQRPGAETETEVFMSG